VRTARLGAGEVREEVKSGARAENRPVLGEVMAVLRRGEADAVVVAKLDRLNRSVVDAKGSSVSPVGCRRCAIWDV